MNAALQNVRIGTAKTFEDMNSKFKFRIAGDGVVEQQLTDSFEMSAPVIESIQDRKLRSFVRSEGALLNPETAPASKEEGTERLQKAATETLGEGWNVDAYYTGSSSSPARTVVKYSGPGGSQKVDIEHRGREKEVNLGTTSRIDGFEIDHSIKAPLNEDSTMDFEKTVESAYIAS